VPGVALWLVPADAHRRGAERLSRNAVVIVAYIAAIARFAPQLD
jgi:hypothetical protein